MGERPFSIFERWNARENAEWWETSKTQCNSFPANIIELLFSYEEALGNDAERGSKSRPKWFDSIEKRIMMLNLYPFGTENGDALISMFNKLVVDTNFTERESYTTEWKVRRHFVKLMRDFIFTYIKPKCIICLGRTTISDFTSGEFHEPREGYYESNEYKNIIGVSRRGNWAERAREVGKTAAKIVSEAEK